MIFSVFSVSCELLFEHTANHTPRDYTFEGAYESSDLFVEELPRIGVPQGLGQGRDSGAGDLPGLGVGRGLAPQDDLEDQPNYGPTASPAAEPVVQLSAPQFLHLVDQHPVDQQPGGFPSLDQCGVEVVELQSPKVGDLGFRFSSSLCRGA